MKVRLARSIVLLGVLACRSAPTPQKSEPAEASAPAPVATGPAEVVVVDEPVARFGFDAGGRAEIDIRTVACLDDGQVGRVTTTLPRTLKVPVTKELAALDNPASQLRVYADSYFAMLGPPGWRCHGWYNSSNHGLALTPSEERLTDLAFADEAIRVREIYWETSGRFLASQLAARIFPSLRGRARKIMDEGPFAGTLTMAPWPGETLSVTGLLARYEDPPHVSALGADGGELLPDDDAIRGSVRHLPAYDGSSGDVLALIAIRLRAEREALGGAIQADFEERTRRCSRPSSKECWGVTDAIVCWKGTEHPDPRCPVLE